MPSLALGMESSGTEEQPEAYNPETLRDMQDTINHSLSKRKTLKPNEVCNTYPQDNPYIDPDFINTHFQPLPKRAEPITFPINDHDCECPYCNERRYNSSRYGT